MEETKFARIITMKAKPGKGREFAETFKAEVASTAVKLEGMRRLYLLRPVDKKGEFVAISLWDNEGSAAKYAKSPQNKDYGKRLAAVQSGTEVVKKFYVESHVVGESLKEG